MKLRLISFNTQHCRNYLSKKIDFDSVADFLRSSGADIIGLNEMRGKGPNPEYREQTEILAEKLGFYSYFAKALDVPGGGPYGNALLSRFPIENAETLAIPFPPEYCETLPELAEPRCILRAEICGLRICVTHFGLTDPEKQQAVQAVLSAVRQTRCVLMGDFNITPEHMLLPHLRNVMSDTAAFFEGERLSFPSDAPNRRIDYLFTSKDIETLYADIPAEIVSDHRPYVADIRF